MENGKSWHQICLKLTWGYTKIRSTDYLKCFWTLIVDLHSVQNWRKTQSDLNFNPKSSYDTCVHFVACMGLF